MQVIAEMMATLVETIVSYLAGHDGYTGGCDGSMVTLAATMVGHYGGHDDYNGTDMMVCDYGLWRRRWMH